MERGGSELLQRLANLCPDPIAHLLGSLVREGQRDDVPLIDPFLKHMEDAVCDHPRLPGSGSSDDEEGPIDLRCGPGLFRVEQGGEVCLHTRMNLPQERGIVNCRRMIAKPSDTMDYLYIMPNITISYEYNDAVIIVD